MAAHRGQVAANRDRRWVSLVALVVLAALGLIGLGEPFGNGDEVIYAQSVKELADGGAPATLTWQGVVVLQRPVTPFLFSAAVSAVVPGELGLRLGSYLGFLAILGLMAWGMARARVNGLVAAAVLLLCAAAPSFLLFSRALLSDPWFVAAVCLGIVPLLASPGRRRDLVISAAGFGAAVAMKSLAAAIPIVACLPLWIGRARAVRDRRTVAAAVVAFVVVAAPFFVAGFARHGARFWHEHIVYSLVDRARGDLQVGMPGGWITYLRYLWTVDGPWTLAWVLGGPVAALLVGARRRNWVTAYLGVAALAMLLLLSLVATRLPHYLLPVYVTAALATGVMLRDIAVDWRARWIGPALVAGAVVLVSVGLPRQPHGHFLPDHRAVALGELASRAVPENERILILEWYAPAFGYYAARPHSFVTANDGFYAILDNVDFFHAAGVVEHTPNAGHVLSDKARRATFVAGPRESIERADWLVVVDVVGEFDGFALARVRVAAPPGNAIYRPRVDGQ